MAEQIVTLEEMTNEIADMLRTCFEGDVAVRSEGISLCLPNGQSFLVACKAN